jgi:hypothetical protein
VINLLGTGRPSGLSLVVADGPPVDLGNDFGFDMIEQVLKHDPADVAPMAEAVNRIVRLQKRNLPRQILPNRKLIALLRELELAGSGQDFVNDLRRDPPHDEARIGDLGDVVQMDEVLDATV